MRPLIQHLQTPLAIKMKTDGENIWPHLLFRALQIGIHPKDFWLLSLREWRAINGDFGANRPMTKGEFENLEAEFKD